MKIQIHKNYFKRYFEMKWEDVPEFIKFQTIPSNFIAIIPETKEEEVELKQKL